jgi:GNAT superfamily N-acetyltransferase
MGLHYPATDIPRVRSACEFLGQLLSFQFAREEGWMRAGDGRYELQSPVMHDAFRRDGFAISTDPETIDRRAVWNFLCTSYWSAGIDYPAVDRAIDNSLCFTLIAPDGGLAGFGRAVTDRVRFAWLADIFVLPEYRGRGLGVWLVETMLAHPDLRGLRIQLATRDAHGLYERFGFRAADGERIMERPRPVS